MDVHTYELVLKAVFTLRFLSLFLLFTLLLELFFSHGLFFFLLFLGIDFRLLLFESILTTHHIEIAVWFQIKQGWELTLSVNFVSLKSLKIEADSLQVDHQDVRCLSNESAF